jgi:hypothetical protein
VTLADELRDRDDRVPLVEHALLVARLGLASDVDLPSADVVAALLTLPGAVVHTIGAARLLERLDAHVARRHPVDLEFHGGPTVARVPVGDDRACRLVLEDGRVRVVATDLPIALVPADARLLATALHRLADLAEEDRS